MGKKARPTGYLRGGGAVRLSRLQREQGHLAGLGTDRERHLVLRERQRGDRGHRDAVRREYRAARRIQDLHRPVTATCRDRLLAQEEQRLHAATSCVRGRLLLAVLSPDDDLAGIVGRGKSLALRREIGRASCRERV